MKSLSISENIVPLRIKAPDREEKIADILFEFELNTKTTGLKRQTLAIQLTDEKDPYFLYRLNITEEDFQRIKTEQSLIVDFVSFPSKVIELLEQCQFGSTARLLRQQESHANDSSLISSQSGNSENNNNNSDSSNNHSPNHSNSGSSFDAHLTTNGETVLKIIETNPFRNLTHISLQFIKGNDAQIKSYLADQLRHFKTLSSSLGQELTTTKLDLESKIKDLTSSYQEATTAKKETLSNHNVVISELKMSHNNEINDLKESHLSEIRSITSSLTESKDEAVANYEAQLSSLRSELSTMTENNTKLYTENTSLSSTLTELRSRFSSTTSQLKEAQEEVQSLRQENKSLDSKKYEDEKSINKYNITLSALKQQVVDKDETISSANARIKELTGHNRALNSSVEQAKANQSALEESLKTASSEIHKANDLISRLQSESKNLKSKLKSRSSTVSEKEGIVVEKDKLVTKLTYEIRSLETKLSSKESEIERYQSQLVESAKKLEEAKSTITTNQNMINYLNKGLNEAILSPANPSLTTGRAALSSSSSYRPYLASKYTGTYEQIIAKNKLSSSLRQQQHHSQHLSLSSSQKENSSENKSWVSYGQSNSTNPNESNNSQVATPSSRKVFMSGLKAKSIQSSPNQSPLTPSPLHALPSDLVQRPNIL